MDGQKAKYSQYGKELKLILLEKEMSQKELAERVGLNPKRISDIIRGVFPGLKYRARIAEALEIPFDEAELQATASK